MITRSICTKRKIITTEAPDNDLQYPYLVTQNLTTSEHININNKEIVGLPENNRHDLTMSKWTCLCQEFEDDVFKFGFKAAVQIFAARYEYHLPTKFKNLI